MQRARSPDKKAKYQAELDCPDFPMPLLHVWSAFHRLSARRGCNGFGINPISWPDIDAFVRHSRIRLAPWEVRLIEQLDDLFRVEQAKPRD